MEHVCLCARESQKDGQRPDSGQSDYFRMQTHKSPSCGIIEKKICPVMTVVIVLAVEVVILVVAVVVVVTAAKGQA